MICDVVVSMIMAFSFETSSWHEIKICVDEARSQMWELDVNTSEEVNTYQILLNDKSYFIIDEGDCK